MKPFPAILISACFGVAFTVSDARPKAHSAGAQSSWRIYSPPDKSFTVKIPVTQHSATEDYEGLDESTPAGWKAKHSYMAVVSISNPRIYSITVFEVLPAGQGTGDNGIDEFIHQSTRKSNRLTSSKQIAVAGGHGREVTLASKDTEENQFTRVRCIQVGARVYMLLYVTNTADDLYSRSATRFFNSFHTKRAFVSLIQSSLTFSAFTASGNLIVRARFTISDELN